jgi:nucleolar GTP-binding protein
MSTYEFKNITTVLTADGLIDAVLSKTNRKTPTEIHPNFKIQRIRSFYMRKVRFCQDAIEEKLTAMLTEFPKLDDLHPFFGDLINILYDRDHYKLALGQLNSVKNVVANISKDYVKLLKYADSAYRCKMLKRAGLGRMATSLKKLKASLGFLEEVRKHLCRLPSIDPYARSILLTGFPNVGKSSFINNITHANVEV